MDKRKRISQIIRVNQAGEYGATRIYAGQLAVLGNNADIKHMAVQEAEHLKKFNKLLVENKMRPTLLQPLWHTGGFLLGAVTAFIGQKAAHACTIAVEEVIDQHYQSQLNELDPNEDTKELREVISHCHQEELEHKETAITQGGQDIRGYETFSTVVKSISKAAIWLSSRI